MWFTASESRHPRLITDKLVTSFRTKRPAQMKRGSGWIKNRARRPLCVAQRQYGVVFTRKPDGDRMLVRHQTHRGGQKQCGGCWMFGFGVMDSPADILAGNFVTNNLLISREGH